MSAETVKTRLRPFGISFEKSLTDLIKGIRSNNHDPDKLADFFERSIQECRHELKTNDLELKSMALLKLTYLEMYGFDMSWCSFYVLEVISSPKFQHKRIGYLAAMQLFQRQNNDDVLMLMTNLLKKDVNSGNSVETGLAISGIASIVTPELAQDICEDMVRMLSHSKPFVRKKAVLALYKVFIKYPDALRLHFDKVVKRLEDEDGSVVSATVNVICELAHNNPKSYVDLAPQLFGLLKETSNNWMVIRLLKLLSSLCLTEPRLRYILLPEVVDLMNSTQALSLVYESINCIHNGQMLAPEDTRVAKLIINKLLGFIKNDDQDLKYVGLLAFIKTCKIHKDLIKKHENVIMDSMFDPDPTIREKALELIDSLVTDRNIVPIVTRLLVQLIPEEDQLARLDGLNETEIHYQKPLAVTDKYKMLVITKIIQVCAAENYEHVPNFQWYLGVLNDILNINTENRLAGVEELVSSQFMYVGLKVPSIRSRLVQKCLDLVLDNTRLLGLKGGLQNFIWLVGEYYTEYISTLDESDDDDSDNEEATKITGAQIIQRVASQDELFKFTELNDPTMGIYIQAMAKLFGKYCLSLGRSWDRDDRDHVAEVCETLISWLAKFSRSANFEVQERSISFTELLKLALDSIKEEDEGAPNFVVSGYSQLFEQHPIKPVGTYTQQRIPIGIDLDSAIDQDSMSAFQGILAGIKEKELQQSQVDEYEEELVSEINQSSEDEEETRREKPDRLNDPFYISMDTSTADEVSIAASEPVVEKKRKKPSKKKIRKEKVLILGDDDAAADSGAEPVAKPTKKKDKNLLVIDSSTLDGFDFTKTPEEPDRSDEVEQMRQEFEKLEQKHEPVVVKKPKKPKKKLVVIE
ncbi:hypothetical protein OGAPHI_001037 [Ogataea philodendri]|uniref:AP-3 complex subunit delta n=1 Tax=Ogataea philodendri TaxID=1378263 RepID=A0A9P8PES2_9ASCO|nr:uncharacterized protein OGAPHI_001037 [Ogataea philodendri]KAH3670522.1 hypothetical protein OGAPHI_001037 [Ogataea philodendri]